MPDETHQLAEAAARGDAAAVEKLLEQHLPGLRAFVRVHVGPGLRARESCSDLVQSTCREILGNLPRFRHPSDSAFRHWLYTTALRKIANRAEYHGAARRKAPGGEVVLGPGTDELHESRLRDCYQRFSAPGHRMAVREEIERIERAFDVLSAEQREVVTLAHIVGLSRQEIAERIGKSEGAVRVTLHRALARIAEALDSDA